MATESQEVALDTLAADVGRFLDEEAARIDEEIAFLKKVRTAQGLDLVKQEALEALTDKAMNKLESMV